MKWCSPMTGRPDCAIWATVSPTRAFGSPLRTAWPWLMLRVGRSWATLKRAAVAPSEMGVLALEAQV